MTSENWQAFATVLALVVSLGTAVVGWQHAVRANRATREANATAEQALEVARSADARAQRIEDREIERRDVRWEVADRRDVGDRFTITNIGTDTAFHVKLAVHPDGEARLQATADQIPPDGRIEVDIEGLAEQRRARARNAGEGIYLGSAVQLRASVAWQSATGVPAAHDFGHLNI